MPEVIALTLASCATALASGLGALPVSRSATSPWLQALLWGATAGVMLVASFAGLLLPALDEGGSAAVVAGVAAGVAFLLLSRRGLDTRADHVVGLRSASRRTSWLVLAVLMVHSLPEGLAMGSAYASDTEGLGLFVVLAIALQNIPEGTGVALPMQEAGFGPTQQFWAAVLSSAPQPVGALMAYALVEEVRSLLPFSLAFAAGAMVALVFAEIIPRTLRDPHRGAGLAGGLGGGAVMVVFAVALGV
jgi:ZIP family zinc transporter